MFKLKVYTKKFIYGSKIYLGTVYFFVVVEAATVVLGEEEGGLVVGERLSEDEDPCKDAKKPGPDSGARGSAVAVVVRAVVVSAVVVCAVVGRAVVVVGAIGASSPLLGDVGGASWVPSEPGGASPSVLMTENFWGVTGSGREVVVVVHDADLMPSGARTSV